MYVFVRHSLTKRKNRHLKFGTHPPFEHKNIFLNTLSTDSIAILRRHVNFRISRLGAVTKLNSRDGWTFDTLKYN